MKESGIINGIINIYKEAGYTSFDVVAKLRGILKQRKIGHTGTLDPEAVGVLPVVLGNATKLVELLTDKKKEYVAELTLGITTDTQDIWGEVLSNNAVKCSEKQIEEIVKTFIGDIEQIPPMYSAIKVDGKKLYELARAGVTVEREKRPVTIYAIEILSIELPKVKLRVECSKGTYIRTLCHDIGESLGCGGTMSFLKRTVSGQFTLGNALTLNEVEECVKAGNILDVIIPTDVVFEDYAKATLKGELLRRAKNGNVLYVNELLSEISIEGKREKLRLYDEDNNFFALFYLKESEYRAEKMFL